MTDRNRIAEEYFNWMYDLMCKGKGSDQITWRKLFEKLHFVEFTWPRRIPNDKNRAADGIELRYRYSLIRKDRNVESYLTGPCSVLEMMVALAIRCEESIMDDPQYGDRTSHWFWTMVVNLGLGGMMDSMYDEDYVDFVINRFLKHKYEPNGKGGLYYVRGYRGDLTKVEIWYQMNVWLNTFT